MTLRLLPHVVEASVAAGTGAAMATAVRRHSGQLLMAVPHPAARLAGGAMSGRTDLVAMAVAVRDRRCRGYATGAAVTERFGASCQDRRR